MQSKMHDRLNETLRKSGYNIVQNNGQRICFMAEKSLPVKKGCEIFIGKLPRDIFENELLPVFEKVGPVYNMRLMMDFTGMNRGYGFVTYFDATVANMAVSMLHEYEVRPGRRIGVYKSVDNCRLYVGGIPVEKTKEEVAEGLAQYADGIKEVIMYQSHANKALNRGFVFVEFTDHRMAAMARRKLSPGSLVLWGVPILIDWADPLPEVDNNVMSQVTKLYLRNLNIDLTNDELSVALSKFIAIKTVMKIHKTLDYAFVHFWDRKTAEIAFKLLQGMKINNEVVEVMWARPKYYSKTRRMANPPQHFCTSLPPRIRMQVLSSKERRSESVTNSSSSNQSEIRFGSQQSSPSSSMTIPTIPGMNSCATYNDLNVNAQYDVNLGMVPCTRLGLPNQNSGYSPMGVPPAPYRDIYYRHNMGLNR